MMFKNSKSASESSESVAALHLVREVVQLPYDRGPGRAVARSGWPGQDLGQHHY